MPRPACRPATPRSTSSTDGAREPFVAGPGPAVAGLTVIWAYRRTGKFAFHVLTGALETDARTADVPIEFAGGVDAVVDAIERAQAAGRRVLVGWSFYSPDFALLARELAAVRARTTTGAALHVAGGVHATAEPEATLRAGFDLVAIGEGEHLIRELVATLDRGDDPHGVRGVARLDAHGELQRNGRPERAELDAFPPFGPRHRRFGPIEITRGCVYACRFCQTPYFAGASFRHRSVDNVREWVRYLVGLGFRDLRFLTPTSLSYGASGPEPDLTAVEALLAGVREDIGPDRRLWFGTFPSEVRPEHVTAGALALIARYASNRALILGGQSGSDRVLAHSERGHDAATIERAAALCSEHGFVPHVDFLFGLPGEESADVEATFALMDRLVARGAKVHGHTFMPLPGTPFRRAAAGALGPEVRRRLLALSSSGALYGQWQQQEHTARELSRRGR
ncbi:MAG: TIGR04013 family B12-binding domain/radical SAM domain-containing protein [Planctomycetes bacterium]|nr:TIGR04013 family B12-binding domain/radical SAM domain-containing protein [Planctomycetota bacterium]